MNKGVLLVVSGPSGAGKGTICAEFMKRHPEAFLSVSATSRKPRPGDEEGVTYYFKTPAEFEGMIERGELFEYAQFVGNYYGTPKIPAEKAISEGRDVILEIEVQGGFKVKAANPDAVMVFVLPPSRGILKQRLSGRNTEAPEVIEKRIGEAERELSVMGKYDYIIINDDLDEAVKELEAIAAAEKIRVSKNKEYLINEWNVKEI